MAFKKNYKGGSKYNYAIIESIHYNKDSNISVELIIYERDSDILSESQYNILTNEEKLNYIKFLEKYELIWKRKGNHILVIELLNNSEFSLTNLNKVDNNIIKSCYLYIKNNQEIFNSNDWSDD